ncbi:MAG: transcriptional repressor [Anaerolineales bacterium]|nr:transcriptional repressor [Anaerolineales bacterium]
MPDASQFAAEIRRQGYRMTPQRQLVLEAVRALAGHATPGEIYDWVQQQAPAINRATVYRVLGFLCELQLVARFDVAGTTTYELVGPQPHHHLVCRACGGIAHVADEVLDDLVATLKTRYGFEADLQHLALPGLCAACAAAAG